MGKEDDAVAAGRNLFGGPGQFSHRYIADEAAQIAFVRAFNSREGFRGEASLRTWLIRIVFNVAKSMRGVQRETEDPAVLERLPDASEPADELLRRRELKRRVRKSIESLPPR